ncbi:hypothetical protein FQN53_006440 [Emmonsiellopsis sp. PD_33]|nr:hypothetical protein FQN53_006440 [Emmonsiellopsis sp. PD_33]
MDTNEPFPPSTALKAIHTSLHLLYHRNKNQHRSTKWWKWLSMLRRATADLTREVERFEKDDDDDDEGVREIVLRKMGYIRSFVVPRCYVAFSTVVADTQFSALGVVLIASLAQVSQAVRAGESYSSSPPDTADDVMAAAPSHRVDVGEVVKRSAYTPVPVGGGALAKTGAGGIGSPLPSVEGEGKMGRTKRERSVVEGKRGEEKEKEKEKKRKKKKKGNAIDDIFGGL